ncbi:CDP-2,3-bis-(O-geranylgeranyl)-sn-glycerol synthase [Halospina denitrificans]|uniref:CDP-2,3-bis-(O-geranylgeranyl)-sn-glycerol synthase n=1 Tax=Halospina denitrificans TaxID=332522 RepID=A0A4R7JPW6_9GAMM|nr:CDP-archaeol synthase [Halospina denitrificans]TDT40140.1 CDP-2,3-bis-(O-geranylgeranyl)-sn-glycerol synthase [Halospina denitrificans]
MLLTLDLVVLLIVANGAPMVLSTLLGHRGYPVDCGWTLWDGRRLFGRSKSWRGLAISVAATGLIAWLMGLGAVFGGVFAAFAMLGDLASSFTKRRLGLVAGDRARGLDQLPEGLLPAIPAWWMLDAPWWVLLLAALIFSVLNIWGSPLLYRWGLRRRPH